MLCLGFFFTIFTDVFAAIRGPFRVTLELHRNFDYGVLVKPSNLLCVYDLKLFIHLEKGFSTRDMNLYTTCINLPI